MNHGFASHTNLIQNNEYKITLNYNNLSNKEIYEDILKLTNLKSFLDKNPDTFESSFWSFNHPNK